MERDECGGVKAGWELFRDSRMGALQNGGDFCDLAHLLQGDADRDGVAAEALCGEQEATRLGQAQPEVDSPPRVA